METIIVLIVVGLALLVLGRMFYKAFRRAERGGGACVGCAGCSGDCAGGNTSQDREIRGREQKG
ncbi:MAG TPA: FeoB-associated Cys-rich membrane protein [Proteobacteria bacterium]|nr:FeoB-associated Cys-rich membrane protein [Deltaproteobacteria bacterium]HDS15542.1 FeoB-associated Cys-rich membrane protein [Pseudomonadota bacterium]